MSSPRFFGSWETILIRFPVRNFIRTALFLGIGLLLAASAAQAAGPHGDLFAGYSTFGFSSQNGAEAALHLKVWHFAGVEGDLSGYKNGANPEADRVFLYLAGPRVTASAFHIRAFAHGLVGGVQPSGGTATSGAFLYGAGGGVDLPVFHRVDWRVAGDYVHAPSGIATGKRFSTGPVLRF
jgi:hypothetical protein